MVDLSEVEDNDYQKRILAMLQRHQQMWSGQLGEIKEVSQGIQLKPGTRQICQQACRAGPRRTEIIEEHVTKILAAEFI